MSAFERRSFAVAVALGLIYLVLLPFKPYPLSWLLKPIPMLTFAVLAWRAHPGKTGFFLGADRPKLPLVCERSRRIIVAGILRNQLRSSSRARLSSKSWVQLTKIDS